MNNNEYQISVECPSNIAFVKYWGKKEVQYPINPSISMTLRHCVTRCHVNYRKTNSGFALENYTFESQENEAFQNRVQTYLSKLVPVCPTLENLSLSIATENTFPHSAGIASSASAFGALGFAIAQIESKLSNKGSVSLHNRASELARLGSGSAARSIPGPYTIWGDYEPESSINDYAQPIDNIHESFKDVKNTILLIDNREKKTSSSQGHALMDHHIFRDKRIKQANQNVTDILAAMRSGDWEKFGQILETEALTLHALMMTSTPSVLLLSPQSIEAIEKIREFRSSTNIPLYFTIDAGPNIHLIYPKNNDSLVGDFVKTELSPLCQNNNFIDDECGSGARVTN